MVGNHSNGDISNRACAPGTIHVGYLVGNITKHELRQYFSQFGRVIASKVIHAITNEKMAFNYGFVTFWDFSVVDRLLDNKYKRRHFIKGNLVIIGRAVCRRDTYNGKSVRRT